jgi:hypothetical protein
MFIRYPPFPQDIFVTHRKIPTHSRKSATK